MTVKFALKGALCSLSIREYIEIVVEQSLLETVKLFSEIDTTVVDFEAMLLQ